MPEGPEIRIAVDYISQALTGRVTTGVFFAFDHLKPYEARLTGQIVSVVEARGKAVLTRFGNGLNIYSHNQLYGVWIIQQANTYPDTARQLRLAVHNGQKSALLYSASDIEVLQDDEVLSHPFLSKLGPDLLADSVILEDVIRQVNDPRFQRRSFSSLLLDQKFLAGLGNYLRSEVLFSAQLHPLMRPLDCSSHQLERLAFAAIELTRQSYHTKGITNDLERAKRLQQQGVEHDQYRFLVFNRDGEPCYRCGTPIIKDILGGRRCYFCPNCQEKPL